MRVAVVGASGEVGRTMIRVLEERGHRPDVLELFASERSAGSKVSFAGRELTVRKLDVDSWKGGFDYVLLSAGGSLSKVFSPVAADGKTVVIDNSSAWRMTEGVPLVVPEINGDLLKGYRGIVANPNCSTIQMVLALAGIHRQWGLKTVVVSSYQSVSGAGHKGIAELQAQEKGSSQNSAFVAPIFENVIPLIGPMTPNGFSEEEMKMVNEPHKILRDDEISIFPTTVRVPVLYGHSESVFAETRRPFGSVEELERAIASVDNVTVSREPVVTPRQVEGTDETVVSRVRAFDDRKFLLWNVADNVRVGAATNAVRIMETHIKENS